MQPITVIIVSYERPCLLQQTIESLRAHSDRPVRVVVIDNASRDQQVRRYLAAQPDLIYVQLETQESIASVKHRGYALGKDAGYLLFSDNDVYFEPQWDSVLIAVLETHPLIGIVGGRRHPHHGIQRREGHIVYSDQQAGYSICIRTADYDRFGPWRSDTLAGGEDVNLCTSAAAAGLLVASVEPPVILHCGATGATGTRAADYAEIMRLHQARPDIYVE